MGTDTASKRSASTSPARRPCSDFPSPTCWPNSPVPPPSPPLSELRAAFREATSGTRRSAAGRSARSVKRVARIVCVAHYSFKPIVGRAAGRPSGRARQGGASQGADEGSWLPSASGPTWWAHAPLSTSGIGQIFVLRPLCGPLSDPIGSEHQSSRPPPGRTALSRL